jgi:WD40 repeat protein
MIVIAHTKRIHVYDTSDIHQTFTLIDNDYLTSVNVSIDSRYLCCNISKEDGGGVKVWDLRDKRMVSEFTGPSQNKFVLRASFGGKHYVISGGEDCKIYIWERASNKLVSVLQGHVSTVNCIAWNNHHTHMFASASDDTTVRIFT